MAPVSILFRCKCSDMRCCIQNSFLRFDTSSALPLRMHPDASTAELLYSKSIDCVVLSNVPESSTQPGKGWKITSGKPPYFTPPKSFAPCELLVNIADFTLVAASREGGRHPPPFWGKN
ncbi:hypothetical protein AVEN_116427-1 [Araneus ventricosus]|uniref:Uncharacterized protein n=1 Tax=Araneus ventricosus TaxID=182803 RepID=A0A4Y2KJN2_ARAVE|nr:hypothetical protein AVEN_116427-1 [Araneus ventricosus]